MIINLKTDRSNSHEAKTGSGPDSIPRIDYLVKNSRN